MRRIRAVMLLGVVCVVAMIFSIVFVNTSPAARTEVRTSNLALPGPPTTTTTVPPPTTTTSPPTTTTQKPVKALRASPATKAVTEAPTPSGDVFDRLAQCESGMHNDTGDPYWGYFQFLRSTWRSMGETGVPSDHSYAVQKAAAQRLVARSGWSQFPQCARKLGMR